MGLVLVLVWKATLRRAAFAWEGLQGTGFVGEMGGFALMPITSVEGF
jgi:hypothetical protein